MWILTEMALFCSASPTTSADTATFSAHTSNRFVILRRKSNATQIAGLSRGGGDDE